MHFYFFLMPTPKRTERWFEKNESEIVNHDYSNLDSTIRAFLEKYYN